MAGYRSFVGVQGGGGAVTSETARKEVTEDVQATVVKRELINSTSPLRITPGMRRALAGQREGPPDVDPRQEGKRPSPRYDAFLAYHHRADRLPARYLWLGLEHLVTTQSGQAPRPRIFRSPGVDDSTDLLQGITAAIHASTWFVLLASPESAGSLWIGREIERWLAHKPAERILIVHTAGDCVWDTSSSDFDFDRSSAIHPELRHVFARAPVVFDMSWASKKTSRAFPLDQRRYFDLLADLGAVILGLPRDEAVVIRPSTTLTTHNLRRR
jgi:hypothetical protein